MDELENKNLDSFIWSSTYERYEKNILKDKEDKKLGQWNLNEDKIKNLKYSYVFLKDSGGLIVKKYTIEKFEKSGFDKDFSDPNKWCFIFSESEDFFAEYPKVVQGRQYGSSLELDNLKKLPDNEVRIRLNQSKNINSSEGKQKPKTSGVKSPIRNKLSEAWQKIHKDKKLPNAQIVSEWVKNVNKEKIQKQLLKVLFLNKMDFSKLKDEEVVNIYPEVLKELKSRGIIKTNNLIGDLGEYLAIKTYSETPGLPKLQDAPASTKNIDAISTKGERYTIKSTSGTGTGVFASLPTKDDNKIYFEYLILVLFDKNYILKEIYELTWEQFIKLRVMKTPENKWNLPITNTVKKEAKKIK